MPRDVARRDLIDAPTVDAPTALCVLANEIDGVDAQLISASEIAATFPPSAAGDEWLSLVRLLGGTIDATVPNAEDETLTVHVSLSTTAGKNADPYQ